MYLDKNKKVFIVVVLLFFLFFSTPQLLRFKIYNHSTIGTTPYYHIRMAEMIQQGKFYDSLSLGGRPYTYPPLFHFILAVFFKAKYFINPFFGAIGLVLIYFFARELGYTEKESIFSSVILGLIPGYAYLSLHLNPRLPALIFLISSYYFMLKYKKEPINSKYLVIMFFTLTALTHTLIAVVGFIFGLFLFKKNIRKYLKFYSIGGLISIITWYLPLYLTYGITHLGLNFYNVFMELRSGVQYFIAESGVVADSVGIFALFLALYAIFKFRNKSTIFLRNWFFLAVITSLIIGNRINEFLWFPIALLIASLFPHWDDVVDKLYLKQVYNNPTFWLALLFAYLTFLGTSTILIASTSPPSIDSYNSMLWLKQNTPVNAIIMGYWEDGHWITGIANRKDVIDAYAEYAPDIDDRYRIMQVVFDGSDLTKTLEALKKYNVSYIYFPMFNTHYCTGFAYKTRYAYFKLVHEDGMKFIYKVDYSGKSTPTDLCKLYVK